MMRPWRGGAARRVRPREYELRSNHTFVYTDGICDQSLEFRLTADVLDIDVSAYSCVTEAQDLAIDVYFHRSAFSRMVAP